MLSLIRIPYATYESIITKGMEDGELKPDDPQDVCALSTVCLAD